MSSAQLIAGATTNLGSGQVRGNLIVTAPSAGTFTVSVAGGPPVPYALGGGGSQVTVVNGVAVSVVNTTAGVNPPAGTLVLYW